MAAPAWFTDPDEGGENAEKPFGWAGIRMFDGADCVADVEPDGPEDIEGTVDDCWDPVADVDGGPDTAATTDPTLIALITGVRVDCGTPAKLPNVWVAVVRKLAAATGWVADCKVDCCCPGALIELRALAPELAIETKGAITEGLIPAMLAIELAAVVINVEEPPPKAALLKTGGVSTLWAFTESGFGMELIASAPAFASETTGCSVDDGMPMSLASDWLVDKNASVSARGAGAGALDEAYDVELVEVELVIEVELEVELVVLFEEAGYEIVEPLLPAWFDVSSRDFGMDAASWLPALAIGVANCTRGCTSDGSIPTKVANALVDDAITLEAELVLRPVGADIAGGAPFIPIGPLVALFPMNGGRGTDAWSGWFIPFMTGRDSLMSEDGAGPAATGFVIGAEDGKGVVVDAGFDICEIDTLSMPIEWISELWVELNDASMISAGLIEGLDATVVSTVTEETGCSSDVASTAGTADVCTAAVEALLIGSVEDE
jgi:hypothetical protein